MLMVYPSVSGHLQDMFPWCREFERFDVRERCFIGSLPAPRVIT